MEIPFKSTENEFELEFKKALGFVDIDIPYIKIRPDLKASVNELIKVIGRPTYDELIKNYKLNIQESDGASTPFQNVALKEVFQYAVAVYAYMLYAPSNDLAHTSNGRRMRSTENEKTPFQWMVAKDDDNLQKRAFKALDALIIFMDSDFDFWKESEQFQITHHLFVRTLQDFSSAYVLDSRLLLIRLVPGLIQSENREILPRINQELQNSLKEKIVYKAKGLNENTDMVITSNEALLIDLIKEASAYYSLYWGLPRLQLNLFPEGILQSVRTERATVKGRSVPLVPIIDQISKLFKADCDEALIKIENLIKVMYPPEVVELTDQQKSEDTYGFDEDDTFVTS